MKTTKKYLQKITKEETKKLLNEVKSYVGTLGAGALGAADLGLNHLEAPPAEEDYSPVDRYLAQRSTRIVEVLLKHINRAFGKVFRRLADLEANSNSSGVMDDGPGDPDSEAEVEIDPSQWPDVSNSDPRKGKGLQEETAIKITKKYLQKMVEEETKKFLKEKLYPGSYPVDGSGQSGIPDLGDDGTGAKERSKKDPESETESGPEEVSDSQPPLALYIQHWCSLEALIISAPLGDHRHLAKTDSKDPILETAIKRIQMRAIRARYTPEEIMRAYKSMKPKFDKASETYQFTEKELWKITHGLDERLPENERDKEVEAAYRGRFTNIEAYMDNGMPKQETRPSQYGMPLRVLADIVRSAENALKSVGLSKYAEAGPDWPYLFRPYPVGALAFKLIKSPTSVVSAVKKK